MLGCEPFTPEQEKALLDNFNSRHYAERNCALLTFGIQTGFRISEILSLTIGDIIKSGRMTDRVYVQKKNMKGGKSENHNRASGRSMPLAPKTKKALQRLIDHMASEGKTSPDEYLFQGQRGGNTAMDKASVWRLLNHTAKALGMTIKVGTHSMRKTFAARIYQNLMDNNNSDGLRILQAGLGHSNINNTIKYLSFREDDLMKSISEVFG